MDDDGNPYFIAIGASGGEGLHDIIDVLRALPRPLFAVVMVVLHRPSEGISYLQQVLSRSCPMPVIIAQEAESMEPGVCYIGEPDGHLTLVERNLAHLVPGSKNRLRNRTIDTLFNSLATHASGRIIGVVLSGALDDGSRGLAAIHHAGGLTMVLDPGIKPRGMQQNAIDFDGPISFIGDAKAIAYTIGRALNENLLPVRR
jgi:two-component system chemotaxis response regulator CheB